MRPLAHHLGEDSLVNLLLVGGAGLSLMVVQGRARLAADRRFFPNGDAFRGLRVHQTRLQAGDASSDSYCFTS